MPRNAIQNSTSRAEEEGCEKTGRVYSYYFIIKRQNLKAGDLEEKEFKSTK
jgi:hypothetical protein